MADLTLETLEDFAAVRTGMRVRTADIDRLFPKKGDLDLWLDRNKYKCVDKALAVPGIKQTDRPMIVSTYLLPNEMAPI